MIDMCVVTTATIRPDILEKTYQSFSDNMIDVDFKELPLYLNIDPLPLEDKNLIPQVISVAEKFFKSVDVSTPNVASFPLAVKRLYQKASHHKYVFDLQDDWILTRPVEVEKAIKVIGGDITGVTFNTYNFTKFPLLYCISPTISIGSWVNKVYPYIKPNISPEQQFRHNARKQVKVPRYVVARSIKYPDAKTIIVKDIGREWLKGTKYKKQKNDGKFTTWEIKPGEKKNEINNINTKILSNLSNPTKKTHSKPRIINDPFSKSERIRRRKLRQMHKKLQVDDGDYSLLTKNKPKISIFVTAYKSQNYIESCLDSIESQTFFKNNDNFEVLVGVDGCKDTLKKLKKIKHKYRNLRVFMMEKNMGTYITSNTLLDFVKYDNIIRFDSDDIMKPQLVESLIPYVNKYDIIRFRYDMFQDNINNIINSRPIFTHGVVLYKKHIFDKAGGYMDWICAADTELIERVKNIANIKMLENSLFYRRTHEKSLTKNKQTGANSEIRKKYKILIGKHKSIWIDKVTNNYKEI